MKRQDIPIDENSLDDPQWYRNLDINTVAADSHDMMDSNPAIRTLGGALDFLHGVEHELADWWKHEVEEGRTPPDQLPEWLRKNLPYRPNKFQGTVDVEASEDVDLSTYVVGTQNSSDYTMIARPRQDRFRVIVTNWGPGILYVAHQTTALTISPTSATGNGNWVQIAVNASREFRTRAVLYAFPTSGQTPTVDVQDEFGYRP